MYDRKLLEQWSQMEDWGEYVDKGGCLNKYGSKEGCDFLSKEYFAEVRRRINYCKKLLKKHDNAFLNYTIAKLYDNYDVEESSTYLYKQPVKYYCLKTLELDPNFEPAKILLQRVQEWIEIIGGDNNPDNFPNLDILFEEENF